MTLQTISNIVIYSKPLFCFGSKLPICGDDWRNFEPKGRPKTTVSFNRVDRIVRDLRRIYKENPAYFDVPAFAQKVY